MLDGAAYVDHEQEMQAPYELVKYVAEHGKLPVVNFAAGGVATPADAALMMQVTLGPGPVHSAVGSGCLGRLPCQYYATIKGGGGGSNIIGQSTQAY